MRLFEDSFDLNDSIYLAKALLASPHTMPWKVYRGLGKDPQNIRGA